MNLLRKVTRGLTIVAMAPLASLERKERDRRLQERFKRAQQKQFTKAVS